MVFTVTDEEPGEDLAAQVLTTEQVAELLHTTPLTITRLARKGELPGKKVGGRWMFLRRNVLDYLDPSS